MNKILWQKQAITDLYQVREYLQALNPQAARATIERIEKVVNQLRTYPMSGRMGREPNTRELVISRTPFLVVYRVTPEAVEILSVFHTSKQWPDAV